MHLDIIAAAIKLPSGLVIQASCHALALEAEQALLEVNSSTNIAELCGFVTKSGDFISRIELERILRTKICSGDLHSQ